MEEVEEVLKTHASVRDAVAVGVPDDKFGEAITAVVELDPEATLDEAGITLNKNTIPDDPRSPFVTSGVRIGTPSVTTQGMTDAEMPLIAALTDTMALIHGTRLA